VAAIAIVLCTAAAAVLALVLSSSTTTTTTPTRGTRYVSPTGSDSGPGSAGQPWRTLAKAVSAARPGDTVVLRAGTYAARGDRTNWTASGTSARPISFVGDAAGQRPTILGYNKIEGSHLRIRDLIFQGPTGRVDSPTGPNPDGEEVMIWLVGGDVELAHCEVTGSRWHAGVYVAGAGDVRILANYIHDNGNFDDPAQANLDQGIYWGQGSGGLIADNLIVHNVADGIQLYPDARNVTVEQNTIVGNGKSGVILADNAADNTIASNIVANNVNNSIRSFNLRGTGNVVENNVVWNNGNGNIGTNSTGLTMTGNIQADPRFAGPGDYRLLAGSPAIGRALRTPVMLAYDITGAPRSPHADIGAYQSK
jgi:parallel beta-helix repeat protein